MVNVADKPVLSNTGTAAPLNVTVPSGVKKPRLTFKSGRRSSFDMQQQQLLSEQQEELNPVRYAEIILFYAICVISYVHLIVGVVPVGPRELFCCPHRRQLGATVLFQTDPLWPVSMLLLFELLLCVTTFAVRLTLLSTARPGLLLPRLRHRK